MCINVKSEISPLKKVLLHRPGNELLNLTPNTLERLLFDDIPYLKNAIKEHDFFANILKDNEVEVIYLEDLATESIKDPKIREQFIKQFIIESGIKTKKYQKILFDFFDSFKDNKKLILKTMEGINLKELQKYKYNLGTLIDYMSEGSEFITDPMPNLYFTRDSFACIGNGVSLNKMYSITRNRETIYGEYIFKYHPEYSENKIPLYYNRYNDFHIEGGDILNLTNKTLAVGISQRTHPDAIEILAENIFNQNDNDIDTILAFNIPNNRAMMHLDTVFTQIDYDKFTIHPGIQGDLQVFKIKKKKDKLEITERKDKLENILSKHLNVDKVTLIPCGGGDKIIGEREQWSDGSNTLCIKPGTIVVYDRNEETNKILREHGINVIEMPSAELSRGRGGPRCMSMPLVRE